MLRNRIKLVSALLVSVMILLLVQAPMSVLASGTDTIDTSGFNAFDESFMPSDFMTSLARAATKQESEPNGSSATADTIEDGESIYGTISSSAIGTDGTDVDYYKLTLAQNAIVNFWIECATNNNKYYYLVKTESGTILGRTSSTNKLVYLNLTPGTYYIVVYGQGGFYDDSAQYLFRTKQYFDIDLPITVHDQTAYNTCGPANAIMLLKYFNKSPSSDDDYAEQLFFNWTVDEYGENFHYAGAIAAGINNYLKQELYAANYVGGLTQTEFDDKIVANLRNYHPVIALIAISDTSAFPYTTSGHYVLVRGISYNPVTQVYTVVVNDSHYMYNDPTVLEDPVRYMTSAYLFNCVKAHLGFIIHVE